MDLPARFLAGLVAASALIGAPAARAEHIGRPSQPACRTSAHFVLHCDPGTSDSYVDAGVAAFEEAYSHDVAGGGGDPNAGLAPPVDDGDGHTDVYISTPPGRPDFSGGIVYRDPHHVSGRGQAAYIFLTPNLSLGGFRFRAAHELMHVLLRGYFGMYGPRWEEGLANWAAENGLPDVDPGDNNFGSTQLPFDCTTPECGQGYWQWLFFQRQSEDFGPGFVESLLRRAAAAPSFSGDFMPAALREELAARTGRPAEEALRVRFADYARKVWDPSAWRTTALSSIYEDTGQPGGHSDLSLYIGFPETDYRTSLVDHLSAVYTQLRFDQTGADDDVRVTIVPPPGQLTAPDVLVGPPNGPRADVPLAPDGSGGFSTILTGPLAGKTAVVPLVNDSETADAQEFTWHAELLMADARMTVAPKQKLRTVLKRGLALKVSATKPVALRLSATIDARAARKYKLGRRRTRITGIKQTTMQAGSRTVTLAITSKARKRLAKAKRLTIDVTGRATFPRGTYVPLERRVSLNR